MFVLASAFASRKVDEISFNSNCLTVGDMRAIDYFDDDSFYLLKAPGHAVGQLNALARTTAALDPTFMLLVGESYTLLSNAKNECRKMDIVTKRVDFGRIPLRERRSVAVWKSRNSPL